MEEKHIKILAGLFLGALVIYLLSKSDSKNVVVLAAKQIADAAGDAVKGGTDAAATAASAVAASV